MRLFPREVNINITFKIKEKKPTPKPPFSFVLTGVTLVPTKFWEKGIKTMQMTDLQTAVAHIEAVDAEGNPAKLDNVPTWVSDNPGTVIVEASPDGMSAVFSSPTPGPLGSAVVTVSAIVAGNPVEATVSVDIIASDAVAINVTTDAPTP